IRDLIVTGVQTCALPILSSSLVIDAAAMASASRSTARAAGGANQASDAPTSANQYPKQTILLMAEDSNGAENPKSTAAVAARPAEIYVKFSRREGRHPAGADFRFARLW